ncbi:hypothetical protein GGF43_000562, partial [Coemansia sp. RSA 2618]
MSNSVGGFIDSINDKVKTTFDKVHRRLSHHKEDKPVDRAAGASGDAGDAANAGKNAANAGKDMGQSAVDNAQQSLNDPTQPP